MLTVLRRPWLLAMAVAAILLIAAVACEDEEEGPGETPAGETPTDETPAAGVTPGPGVTDTEIKLGMTNDLAGTGGTPYGIISPAMAAYFQKINEEDGGVCGRTISFLTEDDQYSGPVALEKTRKLVEQDEVFAIVGALGTGNHLAVVDYLNDPNGDGDTSDGVPDLFVSTGWSGWGDYETWPWTIGYIPDYVSDGSILTRYINENLAGMNVGILYQNDPFGEDYLNSLRDTIDDPSRIVAEQSHEATNTDVSSQILNIRDAGAEVVMLGSTPRPSASAIVTANTQGYEPQWINSYVNAPTSLAALVGGGQEPEQVAAGFELIAGTVGNNYILDPIADAESPEIVEHARIMETYNGPSLSTLSVYGQSLAELVVETLSRSCDNLTRDGLLAAAESIQGFATSLVLEGIEINLSSTDHYAIQALQPVEIQMDGTLAPIGEIISLE